MSSKSTSFITGILALSAAGLLIFAGIGYTAGWIEVTDTNDQTTIEFDKKEASDDTKQAWEKSEEFIDNARETVAPDDAPEEQNDPEATETPEPAKTPEGTATPEPPEAPRSNDPSLGSESEPSPTPASNSKDDEASSEADQS